MWFLDALFLVKLDTGAFVPIFSPTTWSTGTEQKKNEKNGIRSKEGR